MSGKKCDAVELFCVRTLKAQVDSDSDTIQLCLVGVSRASVHTGHCPQTSTPMKPALPPLTGPNGTAPSSPFSLILAQKKANHAARQTKEPASAGQAKPSSAAASQAPTTPAVGLRQRHWRPAWSTSIKFTSAAGAGSRGGTGGAPQGGSPSLRKAFEKYCR